MSESKPIVLCFGVPPHLLQMGSESLSHAQILSKEYSPEILEIAHPEPVALVLCGFPKTNLSLVEISQSMRMLYPKSSIYFLTESRKDYHRKDLQKNGFTDVFFLPSDKGLFLSSLQTQMSQATKGEVKAYRTVQLIDIVPETVLGFDLYLHLQANNKKIRYVSKSEPLSLEKSEKLKKHHFQSGLVTEDQMKNFFHFTAQQLKKLNNKDGLSETERLEKKARAVRDLLTGIFSDSSHTTDNLAQGKQILNDCQEIVKAYVIDDKSNESAWFAKIAAITNNENTAYSHASNTSTLAAMFSIALEVGDPKEMALAGLLHDIGLSDVPAEISLKSDAERTPQEKEIYEKHPLRSVAMIKERKMLISENVVTAIEQHHERFHGGGYPSKMPGPKISKEAQLLAFADMVDEMIEPKPGKPVITVPDAVEKICTEALSQPASSPIDPGLLRKIRGLFNKQKVNGAA